MYDRHLTSTMFVHLHLKHDTAKLLFRNQVCHCEVPPEWTATFFQSQPHNSTVKILGNNNFQLDTKVEKCQILSNIVEFSKSIKYFQKM